MTAPAAPGTYELRLFANDTWTLIGSCTYQVGIGRGPSLAINDVTVTEGNAGPPAPTFNVTLSAGGRGHGHGELRHRERHGHRRVRLRG